MLSAPFGSSYRSPLKLRRAVTYALIVVVLLGIPLLLEWVTTPLPVVRKLHIEAFRYGTSPSIIRANRGDELIFTFSTRDTGHSFFLQDYDIDIKISPASERVEIRYPSDISRAPVDARAYRLKAGLSGWWGKLVSISRFRCHVYCGPMHGFEQGDLIVRPNWLLAGSLGTLLSILAIALYRTRGPDVRRILPERIPLDLNGAYGWLDRLVKWRPLQFFCTLPVLALFILVVLAGLFGTKVSGRNMAVMMTWVAWMSSLALVLLPLGGRIWCLICPLPVMGEYLQRGATTQVRPRKEGRLGNRLFGLGREWPQSMASPWLRLIVLLGLGTLSASLAGKPRWTAIALLSMVFAAGIMSLIWERRAFCRSLCPVAAYLACYSAAGRLMVQKRDARVCRHCRQKACFRGNEAGWACPYGLTVANLNTPECGLCFECFKSCPYNNVSLGWRRERWTRGFSTYGQAWQSLVLLVLAGAYSVTIHSPWPALRDAVNVVDKASWLEFALLAALLWALSLGIIPLMFWLTTALGTRFAQPVKQNSFRSEVVYCENGTHPLELTTGLAFKKTMSFLIPLGLSLWAAFFCSTLMVNFTFVLLTLSDPFGWGWDLLGTAGMPWVQIWPSGIPWIQSALLLIGLTFSLRRGYAAWLSLTAQRDSAVKGFAPSAGLCVAFAAALLVYFTNF